MSASYVSSTEIDLAAPRRHHLAVVTTRGEVAQVAAECFPESPHQGVAREGRQVADRAHPQFLETGVGRLADPPEGTHRLGMQVVHLGARRDQAEAVGLGVP